MQVVQENSFTDASAATIGNADTFHSNPWSCSALTFAMSNSFINICVNLLKRYLAPTKILRQIWLEGVRLQGY